MPVEFDSICTCCITPGCRRQRQPGVFRCWFCLGLLDRRRRQALGLPVPERLQVLQRATAHLDAMGRCATAN